LTTARTTIIAQTATEVKTVRYNNCALGLNQILIRNL